MDEYRSLLTQTLLFKDVADNAFCESLTEPVSYAKGETIYSGKDYRKALGVVLSGSVTASPEGDPRAVLSLFEPGSVFGAAALFGQDGEYVSRITAKSDCKVLFIDEKMLLCLFREYPQTAVNYISFLSSRIRFLNEKIALFTQSSAEGRLYRYLTSHCDDNGIVTIPGSMTALSNLLCIGRTSLYREIETLENKNLLVRKDGKYRVIL